jgi:hypothetical protein
MPSTSSTAKRATGPVVLSDRGLAGLATFGDPMERVRRNLHEQLGPPGGPAIDGLLSDATANGRVTQLYAGQGCGE